MKRIVILALLVFCCFRVTLTAQVSEKPAAVVPASFCVSVMENKLYNMINAYRQRYDLPPIPLSKSLCFVASTHVKDLFFHHPDQGSCNSHSWSDQGSWRPFCYPRDENKKNSIWDKPKELTEYRGKGYEIVYWENSPAVIDSIIVFWKSMDYFNSFLMNTGKWQGKRWNAIGIGIYENYACAWFGELADPAGEPLICGQEPPKPQPLEKPGTVKNEAMKKEETKSEPVKKPVEPVTKEKKPKPAPVKVEKTPVVPVNPAPLAEGKEYYFIIIKGVAPEKEQQRFLKDVQAKGYTTARVIEKNGKLRVSVMEFTGKTKADSALRVVKKTWPDAWLLKQ
ncbi:MAG: CAP domain-containing protein [Bacteroidetes bacterium]|nr:CAP domain-containing protein [Bacteroidota bacterium]